MPRPPRLEFAGAIYHVTVRGVQQSAIFVDDDDRMTLLAGDEAFVERMKEGVP